MKTKKKINKKKNSGKNKKKNNWKGYFENVVYSNGPSDNIYVYG